MKNDADRRNGKKSARIHPGTTERGYGWAHQRVRARLEQLVRSGRAVCVRCDLPIDPDEPWDLGHDDFDRSRHTGPEHRSCNRATTGRRSGLTELPRWSRRWFDNPRPGQTVPLGDGLVEVHVGGGHWETIPASDARD